MTCGLRRRLTILPVVQQLQAQGLLSFRALADALNQRGIKTARGSQWAAMTIKRLLARQGALNETANVMVRQIEDQKTKSDRRING